MLRQGQAMAFGEKVLIVLDQFEQWLHAKKQESSAELVQALRQCDGEHVQCIVMVRDDFWLAVSRFMNGLEVDLSPGQNIALTDLFDFDHARRVLAAFGRAFGKLPTSPVEVTKEQREFLQQSIHGLAEDGKVVCVRLSLFAEMMRGKTWTPTTLKAVGGTQGIGVTFLEETFSSQAAIPKHRLHQKSARAVLKELLPDSGSDIKGNMRSYGELLEASGYDGRGDDFVDLIRVLDSEIRLITPTDPEGASLSGSAASVVGQKYFQLTHDYLVPSLRDWLTRKQKETRRGRAELRLAERAALWSAKPENRHLPSLWEHLNFRLLTSSKHWTDPERRMLRKTSGLQGVRCGVIVAALIGILLAAREINGRFQAASLVNQIASADIAQVPGIVEKLAGYRRWSESLLHSQFAAARNDSREKLHAAIALLPADATKVDYLREQLTRVTPSQFPAVRDAIRTYGGEIIEPLWETALDSKHSRERRFLAACALAQFASNDPRWSEIAALVSGHLVSREASDFLAWRDALAPARVQLVDALSTIYADVDEENQNRRYAAQALATYCSDDPSRLFNLLADAEHFQFSTILPRLAAHKEKGAGLAQAELIRLPVDKATEDEKEALAWRQVNAAVALVSMGITEPVKLFLKQSADPRARSYFIHQYSSLSANAQPIVDQIDSASDASIRRALILTLGEFAEDQLPESQRQPLSEKLLKANQDDPDAGLHGAIEWLLRKWEQKEQLQAVSERLKSSEETLQARRQSNKHHWYVNGEGQTFVIIDACKFLMGSPESEPGRGTDETRHRRRVRKFAIATAEVTQRQYERFARAVPEIAAEYKSQEREEIDELPVTSVTWYEATQYCNWLSEQDGIPAEQWCYEPNEQQRFGPNMSIKPNYLNLSGYRLPTEPEWECACRAGTLTSRYYGSLEALLEHYAWCAPHAEERKWPVGLLKPNDLGLFDMLGNVGEWCHNGWESYTGTKDIVGFKAKPENNRVSGDSSRIYRGGLGISRATEARSANRNSARPGNRYNLVGFRVARSIQTLSSSPESSTDVAD